MLYFITDCPEEGASIAERLLKTERSGIRARITNLSYSQELFITNCFVCMDLLSLIIKPFSCIPDRRRLVCVCFSMLVYNPEYCSIQTLCYAAAGYTTVTDRWCMIYMSCADHEVHWCRKYAFIISVEFLSSLSFTHARKCKGNSA